MHYSWRSHNGHWVFSVTLAVDWQSWGLGSAAWLEIGPEYHIGGMLALGPLWLDGDTGYIPKPPEEAGPLTPAMLDDLVEAVWAGTSIGEED